MKATTKLHAMSRSGNGEHGPGAIFMSAGIEYLRWRLFCWLTGLALK